VGTEHIDDIIADFEQSFKAAEATTTKAEEKPADAEQVETKDQAPLVV
jgi:O-acetylhomoserine/O-acetylserine sulfhydrylase